MRDWCPSSAGRMFQTLVVLFMNDPWNVTVLHFLILNVMMSELLVALVTLDIAKSLVPDNRQLADDGRDNNDQDSGAHDVLMYDEDDIDSDDDDAKIDEGDAGEEEGEEVNISNFLQTTRSGRVCRTWKGRASAINLT